MKHLPVHDLDMQHVSQPYLGPVKSVKQRVEQSRDDVALVGGHTSAEVDGAVAVSAAMGIDQHSCPECSS